MPEYTTFEHFARDLLVFSNEFSNQESWNDLLVPVPLMRDASFLKDYFSDGHSEQFQLIFEKTEYLELQTEEQFFRYAIPRCLNLIDKERYFYSLLLIAGFLNEFLHWLAESRVCHRFHFTAHKCLLAVFKRALEDSFEDHGGFKGLKKYVKGIMKEVFCCPHKNIIDHLNHGDDNLREEVFKLIEKCDDFSDESFHLNDYELSLIRDDDIKNTIELLDSDDLLCEDPLNLKWPPSKEEMQEVLESYRIRLSNWKPKNFSTDFSARLFDGCCDTDSDSDESLSVPDFSDLDNYMHEITVQATDRYGIKIFREKMELRKCPCCGIKCYQFSRNLYLKQLDLALRKRIPKWKNSLRKFISYTRYRISTFFNPYIVYKSKEAPADYI